MAFITAATSRLLLGDFHLSGYMRKVGAELEIAMLDSTVLTSAAEDVVPGLKMGKFPLGGLLDSDGAATGQHRQIFDKIGATAADAVSWGPQGFTRGNPVICVLGQEASYPIGYDVKDIVAWSADLKIDGPIDFGVSLADLAAVTTDTTGTGVDNAASTSNGGAGFLHVTAYSGFSDVVFKVQHSTDNSSWSDLATFTSVTGKTSERVTVAAATTVNRYLRFFADVTGSGSCTCQMSFARR